MIIAESDLASPYKRLFPSDEERGAFSRQFEKLLQPVGAPPLDNHGLSCAMFDVVERNMRPDLFPGNEWVETKSFL